MAEVYIDGEVVVFEGKEPETLGALQALLSHVLDGQRRLMTSLLCDGRPVSEHDLAHPLSSFSRIDVASMKIDEAIGRVRRATSDALRDLVQRLDDLAGQVIRVPWKEAGEASAVVAVDLGSALENAAALAHDPGVAAAAQTVVDATDGWLDTVQQKDAGACCLAIDRSLLPAVRRLAGAIPPQAGKLA